MMTTAMMVVVVVKLLQITKRWKEPFAMNKKRKCVSQKIKKEPFLHIQQFETVVLPNKFFLLTQQSQ